ncbi:MAG: methylmalonyl-CoA mutase family protein [Nitrosopumilaceae archaeon]|nr:methylmalonyl-CoA mutase family protein [Nitrosopumilaceae archaeon]
MADKKKKEETKEIFTDSNFPVKRIYQKSSKKQQKEDAGKYPFTRGIHPGMYRDRFWTMRQYSGFGDAKLTNQRFKYMLEKGQTGLSMAFDLPTQIGHDPDSPHAEGEVGKVGVSIASIKDMMTAFDGIPLGKVSTSMTINSTASTLLAYYIAVGESQGFKSEQLRGTTQNDILKEYIARNTYIYPPRPSMRLIGDMIEYCAQKVPSWYPVSISGYHMREAGCTATQEVAFTLANAIAYIQTCLDRGLKIDDFAPRLSFFFCCTIEFFEEVAKFRVARKVYAKILKEMFHAKNPKSMQLKFHTQTSGESLTAQQPDNNIVRVAIQTMAAVMGGTQSLHTNSRDEALALPTEESAKIALRTQQIVAHESGVTKTVDPMAGSYYLEELCDQIEDGVWKYLKKIEKMGGSVKAIEKGFFQSEIRQNAYRLKKEVDDNERVLIGVNKYVEEEKQPELLRVDEKIEIQQKKALKQLRSSRNSKKVEKALSSMREAAESEKNVMPYIIESAKVYATTGEISNAFRDVFGVYRPKEVF